MSQLQRYVFSSIAPPQWMLVFFLLVLSTPFFVDGQSRCTEALPIMSQGTFRLNNTITRDSTFWLRFRAQTPYVQFKMLPATKEPSARLQKLKLFKNDCDRLTLLQKQSHIDNQSLTLQARGLIPGKTYYLKADRTRTEPAYLGIFVSQKPFTRYAIDGVAPQQSFCPDTTLSFTLFEKSHYAFPGGKNKNGCDLDSLKKIEWYVVRGNCHNPPAGLPDCDFSYSPDDTTTNPSTDFYFNKPGIYQVFARIYNNNCKSALLPKAVSSRFQIVPPAGITIQNSSPAPLSGGRACVTIKTSSPFIRYYIDLGEENKRDTLTSSHTVCGTFYNSRGQWITTKIMNRTNCYPVHKQCSKLHDKTKIHVRSYRLKSGGDNKNPFRFTPKPYPVPDHMKKP